MKRIIRLTESDLTRLVKRIVKETVTAVEPVLGYKDAIFNQDSLALGSATVDSTKETTFITEATNIIKKSCSTLKKYNSLNSSFKVPKFIKIEVGTDPLGGELENVTTYNKRVKKAKEMVSKALIDGCGFVDTQITKFLSPVAEYQPSKIDRNQTIVTPNPKERYIKIQVAQVVEAGNTESDIDKIEDTLTTARGWNLNTDEASIVNGICKLETYSDIEDLDDELRRFGGLQAFINDTITDGLGIFTDRKERRQIKACLNNASRRSGMGSVAAIAGSKLTIILK